MNYPGEEVDEPFVAWRDSAMDINEIDDGWKDISASIYTKTYKGTHDGSECVLIKRVDDENFEIGSEFKLVITSEYEEEVASFLVKVTPDGFRLYTLYIPADGFYSFDAIRHDGNYTLTVDLYNPEYSGGEEVRPEYYCNNVYITQVAGKQVDIELKEVPQDYPQVLEYDKVLTDYFDTPFEVDGNTYYNFDDIINALANGLNIRFQNKGTVAFNNLPRSSLSTRVGHVYRITDDFTTDQYFSVQNVSMKAGTSVYCDGSQWNLFTVASDITVDSAMSDSSENPVQNKVIKGYVDNAASTAEQAAKDYADTAIGNLDAAAVGGSGKIITEVSQTDGVLSATAVDIDSAMSDSSTNVVQNKIIKAYSDGNLQTAKGYSDGNLQSAKDYCDGNLQSAKDYCDAQIAANITNAINAEY